MYDDDREDNERPDRRPTMSGWAQHMTAFVNQEVEVLYEMGSDLKLLVGTLRYFQFQKDSLLIESDGSLYWIKTPVRVKKKN